MVVVDEKEVAVARCGAVNVVAAGGGREQGIYSLTLGIWAPAVLIHQVPGARRARAVNLIQ